jgi:hypothetical protein
VRAAGLVGRRREIPAHEVSQLAADELGASGARARDVGDVVVREVERGHRDLAREQPACGGMLVVVRVLRAGRTLASANQTVTPLADGA